MGDSMMQGIEKILAEMQSREGLFGDITSGASGFFPTSHGAGAGAPADVPSNSGDLSSQMAYLLGQPELLQPSSLTAMVPSSAGPDRRSINPKTPIFAPWPTVSAASGGYAPYSPRPQRKDAVASTSRSALACLNCRRIKAKCEPGNSQDEPCKRCLASGHECIYVESRRGKRAPNSYLVEKQDAIAERLRVLLQDGITDTSRRKGLHELLAFAQSKSEDAALPEWPTSREDDSEDLDGLVQKARNPIMEAMSFSPEGKTPTSVDTAWPEEDLELGDASDHEREESSKIPRKLYRTLEDVAQSQDDITFRNWSDRVFFRMPQFHIEHDVPHVLTSGVIDSVAAVQMFQVFYDRVWPYIPLLNPERDTATDVVRRSPFLFTVVCAIASKYSLPLETHHTLAREAHKTLLRIIRRGEKSIDIVRGCLMLAMYPVSESPWSFARTEHIKIYVNTAYWQALELKLYTSRPAVSESKNATHQNEALERERAWLMLFIVNHMSTTIMSNRPSFLRDIDIQPHVIPTHPAHRASDYVILALCELLSITVQVSDTFHEPLFVHSSGSDEQWHTRKNSMKSLESLSTFFLLHQYVLKLDAWKRKWCPDPIQGDQLFNILMFDYYLVRSYVTTIPKDCPGVFEEFNDWHIGYVKDTALSHIHMLALAHTAAKLHLLQYAPDFHFKLLCSASIGFHKFGCMLLRRMRADPHNSNVERAALLDIIAATRELLELEGQSVRADDADQDVAALETFFSCLTVDMFSRIISELLVEASQRGDVQMQSIAILRVYLDKALTGSVRPYLEEKLGQDHPGE